MADAIPSINFAPELPVSAHVDEIIELLKHNQVIIVCGETGSGKSTQLPKIALQAGYGQKGMIAHTQPRRIAARSVAARVSEELGSPLGQTVGYRVRFSEAISQDNKIRVLTDGMLLAEYQNDPLLKQYEVIIIDEAHERSLNIDFLLGLLKNLLVKRPELKIIVTSATLDAQQFSHFYHDAPTLSVSGRTYPVEIRYRPGSSNSINRDTLNEEIAAAIEELHAHALGDVLIFFPGEREIHSAAKFLNKRLRKGIDILPLYARLSPQEQNRIFHQGTRTRIVLATNVAETSLTVPGIKYVVDTGFARISRYSTGRKIQRLPIERISQAAAKQRSGRCGRVSDGVCIRLYDEEDFESRAAYTDAEITRTSLADVILKMAVMGMGDIANFPFISRPSGKQIRDGINQLIELNAFNQYQSLTNTGRQMARLPIDPRIARMLIESIYLDCLRPMITIAAALSIGDPRIAPADQQQHARERHRQLSHAPSDFLVLIDIWQQFRDVQKLQSKRKAYAWCEENFLSVFRMREWASLQADLLNVVKQSALEQQIKKRKRGSGYGKEEALHRALLSGLISNIAQLDESRNKNDNKVLKGAKSRQPVYIGSFGKQIRIFPASVMRKEAAKWIMTAELVETSELFARTVAPIEPQWIEQQARGLLRYEYSNPFWHRKSQRVRAKARGILYGLTIFANRNVDFTELDRVQSRDIFIAHALVLGEVKYFPEFLQHNLSLAKTVREKSDKLRHRDGFADEQDIVEFYRKQIPSDVCCMAELERWLKTLSAEQLQALYLTEADLVATDMQADIEKYFPEVLFKNQISIPLQYQFAPGQNDDGLTAEVEVALLNQLQQDALDRLVPGLFKEKLIALIKTLPKSIRVNFIPVPNTVERIEKSVFVSEKPLLVALSEALNLLYGTHVRIRDFDEDKLPAHLRMKIAVIDAQGKLIEKHHNLSYLIDKYAGKTQQAFQKIVGKQWQKSGLTIWDFGDLPKSISVKRNSKQVQAYIGLVDEQESVSIQLFDTEEEAVLQHHYGLFRLFYLNLPLAAKYINQWIKQNTKAMLIYSRIGEAKYLSEQLFYQVWKEYLDQRPQDIRTEQQFNHLCEQMKKQFNTKLLELFDLLECILQYWHAVQLDYEKHSQRLPDASAQDIDSQLQWLCFDGFVEDTPLCWLSQYPNYLKALQYRLEQAALNPAQDLKRLEQIRPWWAKLERMNIIEDEAQQEYRWMLEEYRIALFAQHMKKSIKVSPAKIEKQWKLVAI